MYQIIVIFARLYKAVLKVNSPKCIFWIKDIPCLAYVIIWGLLKYNPKKVKVIINIGQTTTTIEAQNLIGVVQ